MKRVNPKVYSTDYFLNVCRGFGHFNKTRGSSLEGPMKTVARKIPSVKNKTVLDAGCGRGEYCYWAAENGAKSVVGIDYSSNAIRLANKMKKSWPKKIREKIKFQVMDAKNIKLKKKMFDVVISTEVFEHLYEKEQEVVLKEIKKVLKDDGFLFIHTCPSKSFIDITYKYFTYPASSLIVKAHNLLTRNNYPNIAKPEELRTELHGVVHINEPTYFQLRRIFRNAGFKGIVYSSNTTYAKPILGWKDKLFNMMVFLTPISNIPPFNIILGSDYYTVLIKS